MENRISKNYEDARVIKNLYFAGAIINLFMDVSFKKTSQRFNCIIAFILAQYF